MPSDGVEVVVTDVGPLALLLANRYLRAALGWSSLGGPASPER